MWTRYYSALTLLSLRLIQGRFKVECFPADCTFILAAYLTHCEWRKWNMCLGGRCDRCDPTGCWLRQIARCFVVTVCGCAPIWPDTIHKPVSDLSPFPQILQNKSCYQMKCTFKMTFHASYWWTCRAHSNVSRHTIKWPLFCHLKTSDP